MHDRSRSKHSKITHFTHHLKSIYQKKCKWISNIKPTGDQNRISKYNHHWSNQKYNKKQMHDKSRSIHSMVTQDGKRSPNNNPPTLPTFGSYILNINHHLLPWRKYLSTWEHEKKQIFLILRNNSTPNRQLKKRSRRSHQTQGTRREETHDTSRNNESIQLETRAREAGKESSQRDAMISSSLPPLSPTPRLFSQSNLNRGEARTGLIVGKWNR